MRAFHSQRLADAAEALSGGDAPSLASFFRGLIQSEAVRGGPQHVCLKRAFALLESRWKMEEADTAVVTSVQPVAFGESLLPPQLFVSVMAFLDPHQAMRSGQTSKDFWRNGVLQCTLHNTYSLRQISVNRSFYLVRRGRAVALFVLGNVLGCTKGAYMSRTFLLFELCGTEVGQRVIYQNVQVYQPPRLPLPLTASLHVRLLTCAVFCLPCQTYR